MTAPSNDACKLATLATQSNIATALARNYATLRDDEAAKAADALLAKDAAITLDRVTQSHRVGAELRAQLSEELIADQARCERMYATTRQRRVSIAAVEQVRDDTPLLCSAQWLRRALRC